MQPTTLLGTAVAVVMAAAAPAQVAVAAIQGAMRRRGVRALAVAGALSRRLCCLRTGCAW